MAQNHWQTCLSYLERELPAEDFNTWIRPLQPRSVKGQTQLTAPNAYVRDYIAQNHLERIRDIYEHLGYTRDSVTVEVANNREPGKVRSSGAGKTFDTGLDSRYQFSNFVQGKSNELGFAAAQQVAQKPGLAYNP